MPCHIQKTVLQQFSPPPVLTVLPPALRDDPGLSLVGSKFDVDVPIIYMHATVTYILCTLASCLLINPHPLRREASLMRVRSSTNVDREISF